MKPRRAGSTKGNDRHGPNTRGRRPGHRHDQTCLTRISTAYGGAARVCGSAEGARQPR